jgi:hypothetical protein
MEEAERQQEELQRQQEELAEQRRKFEEEREQFEVRTAIVVALCFCWTHCFTHTGMAATKAS